MATSQHNLLGFGYFTLFLMHSFVYYGKIDFIDLKSLFAYVYLVSSALIMTLVIILKIGLAVSGKDKSPFDSKTSTEMLLPTTSLDLFLHFFVS
jgi:hypothetical protein